MTISPGPSPRPLGGALMTCPSCQAYVPEGKFCSNCGASLGAARCATCGAVLTPGAKFCHRCGAAVGASGDAAAVGTVADQRSFSAALPWGVAAIALVALVALVAGQRFGARPPTDAGPAPQGGGRPTPLHSPARLAAAERPTSAV